MNGLEIVPMAMCHIDEVYELECSCFAIAWSRKSFLDELKNSMAIYFVAIMDSKVIGYAGMWHVITEGHITNIAVKDIYRGKKIGERLLLRLIDAAIEKEMIGITLEVSIDNIPAQRLYTKHGFKPEGIRKNYYEGTNADAVIMWKYLE